MTTTYVDLPLYAAARPVIDEVTATQVGESTFQFAAEVTEQDLITTRWTVEGSTSRWREPRHSFDIAPDCVDVELRVADRVQYRTWTGCVELNSNPVASVEATRAIDGTPLVGGAAFGEVLLLDAAGSTDPDGDSLTYEWFDDCGLLGGDDVIGAIHVAFDSLVECTFSVTVSDGSWHTTASVVVSPSA